MSIPERYQALAQIWEQGSPFHRLLGLKVDLLEEGRCLLRLPWSSALQGDPVREVAHGGIIATLVDAAGGAACFSHFSSAQERAATIDLRVDYLRPGPAGEDLLCWGEIVRMGSHVAVAQMRVYSKDINAQPIATGQAVYHLARTRRGE